MCTKISHLKTGRKRRAKTRQTTITRRRTSKKQHQQEHEEPLETLERGWHSQYNVVVTIVSSSMCSQRRRQWLLLWINSLGMFISGRFGIKQSPCFHSQFMSLFSTSWESLKREREREVLEKMTWTLYLLVSLWDWNTSVKTTTRVWPLRGIKTAHCKDIAWNKLAKVDLFFNSTERRKEKWRRRLFIERRRRIYYHHKRRSREKAAE